MYMKDIEWNGLKPEIVEKEEGLKISTVCHCRSASCQHAKHHKCTCQCHGSAHSILFKERNKIASLEDYDPNLSDAQETMIQVNSDVQDYFAEHWLKPFSED